MLACGMAAGAVGQSAPPSKKGPDVLVIYSSGTPSVTISDAAMDALSSPTPAGVNVRTLTERLAAALAAKNRSVRVVPALEVATVEEILSAGVVVIGSPSCFGNVSWPIKKVIDELYGRIYQMKNKVKCPPHAAFSMAEIKPSAEAAIATIKNAVRDCNGAFGPTMIVLVKDSPEQITCRVGEFAAQIAAFERE